MSTVTFLNASFTVFYEVNHFSSLLGMPSSSSIHIVSLRTCGTSSVTKYLNFLNSNLNCVSVKSDAGASFLLYGVAPSGSVLLIIGIKVPLTHLEPCRLTHQTLQTICSFIFVFLCNNIA